MRKSYLVFALLIVATMLLAACGGGAEPTATPVPPAPAAEPTATPVPPEPTATPVPPEPTATPEAMAEEPTPTPEAAAEPTPTEIVPVLAEGAVKCEAGVPTLTVWADKERMAALVPLQKQVLDETGICLDLQEVGFGDIRTKVGLAAPAGEGPDLFIGAHDWLGELYANGVVAEVNLSAETEEFWAPALDAFKYEGKQLGMPYASENLALFWNPDLIDAPPATLAEVQTMAQELTDAGAVKQAFALMKNDAYHHEPGLTAFGGYIFGQTETGYDACDVGLDSEGAVAYLTWLDQMTKAGLLDPNVDWETAHVLFESGDAAFMFSGPWALNRFKEKGVNYQIADLPAEVQASSPFLGTQGFFVNAFSPDKVLAETFLKDYIASEPVMRALFEADPRPSAYLAVRDTMDNPDLAAFASAGTDAHPMPAIPAMGSVWNAWGAAIDTVLLQSATPEDAAATAAKQVRDAAECQ